MTEVNHRQTKEIHIFDINNADRFSIKAAVQNGTIQTDKLSIEQRKDLIEDYLIEQGHAVFGECDEINYLEHLIKQPFSIDLKKLVGQQLAFVTIKNYDAKSQKLSRKEAQQVNQSIDKNNDIRTLITKPKGNFWDRIKTSIKSAIESIKNNTGAILPALAAVSFGVIVSGLVIAFATTLPIWVGISIACIGIAALISSLSATIVHYYENL